MSKSVDLLCVHGEQFRSYTLAPSTAKELELTPGWVHVQKDNEIDLSEIVLRLVGPSHIWERTSVFDYKAGISVPGCFMPHNETQEHPIVEDAPSDELISVAMDFLSEEISPSKVSRQDGDVLPNVIPNSWKDTPPLHELRNKYGERLYPLSHTFGEKVVGSSVVHPTPAESYLADHIEEGKDVAPDSSEQQGRKLFTRLSVPRSGEGYGAPLRRSSVDTSETIHLLEFIQDGKAFYTLTPGPNARENRSWVPGPVHAAILALTDYTPAEISGRAVRVRMIPAL